MRYTPEEALALLHLGGIISPIFTPLSVRRYRKAAARAR
jgi:hypothetical protein